MGLMDALGLRTEPLVTRQEATIMKLRTVSPLLALLTLALLLIHSPAARANGELDLSVDVLHREEVEGWLRHRS